VVLEVNSLKGCVNSDEAAVVPLASCVVASNGAFDNSSVALVIQPDVTSKMPAQGASRQSFLRITPPSFEF
jgi:hypothetical protein